MKICLQAGHENAARNSIVALRRSTGAPNEMAFNVDIRKQLADRLRKELKAEVYETDACANDDPTVRNTDWDLFLAIHYDADIYGSGGGFVDVPNPATDGAAKESARLAGAIEAEYFPTTKIANKPNRRNNNTKFYYVWKYLSNKTPCVIIECGVGMHAPDDHSTLHFNRELVVEGLFRGISRAFPVVEDEATLKLKEEIKKLREQIASYESTFGKIRELVK